MPNFNVHSSDVYAKSFTFSQISLNDYAQEQLSKLKTAEHALNNNNEDQKSVNNFMQTAKEVSENLETRYKTLWVNPNQDKL